MSFKKIYSIFMLALAFSLYFPAPVFAERGYDLAGDDMGFTFADLGEGDIKVTTVYEQTFVDFPVPDGRNFNSATLRLHLQHSEALLPDLSDIVIAINNEPVLNVILTPENKDAVLDIPIPVEALVPGENELLLRFSQRLVDNGCSDVGDKNLWTIILADSGISFNAEETPDTNDLSRFPFPFSTFSVLPGSPQVSFVLPPDPTSAELSAAAQIAASLGQAANWKNPPIFAFTVNQADQTRLSTDSLIVIDTGGRNTLADSASPGLTILPSPYNPNQQMLVVSGADDAELMRTVSVLVTRSARDGLSGAHADPADVVPQSLPERPSRSSFADIGLATKRVRGIGLHDLYYPIDIPYDWKTTSEASVEIHFTHGPAITSASLMTVFVNGYETTNVRLDPRNDDDGRLVIQLSPRQIHPGRNWLHIVFDLHMPRENCRNRYFEEAWAEVSSEESIVNLAHVVSIAPLDLHYMPSYLVIPNDLSADLFVLPAVPSSADLTVMTRIAAKLGTYSATDAVAVQATTADQYSPQNISVNVIAIGSATSNALIGQYDAQLPQSLRPVNGEFVPSAGRELLPEEQTGQAGYLEVLAAPWSRSASFLVISADDPELLLRVADIIPTGGRRMREQGNLAVVTLTSVSAFNVGDLAGVSLSPTVRILVAVIFVGAFVLIFIVGGFIVYRRRRFSKEADNDQSE